MNVMLNRVPDLTRLEPPAAEQAFDLREILSFIWRQWKFIAAVVAVSLVIGAMYLAKETPRYTATTHVLLDPRKEKAGGSEAILSDAILDGASIESQMAVIRSTSLLKRVVEKERLTKDPEFGVEKPAGWSFLGALKSLIGREAKTAEPPAEDAQRAERDLIASTEALKGALTVLRAGQSYVLAISINSTDPQRAARLANAVADAFVVDQLDARFEAAKRASAWLSDRLEDLRKQLRAV